MAAEKGVPISSVVDSGEFLLIFLALECTVKTIRTRDFVEYDKSYC